MDATKPKRENGVSQTIESKTYVLVHGAYHGGWCWKEVAKRLRQLGHEVYVPTLTGLGERSHLLSPNVSMETFISDVAQVIRYEELSQVILVGHSFAGAVVSSLCDRIPERLRHAVYLDAQVLQSGQAPADMAPPEVMARYEERAKESGGLSIPPASPEAWGITDPAMSSKVVPLLTPHPYRTYFDKVRLENPIGNGVRSTYIACTEPLLYNVSRSIEVAKRLEGWTFLEIPTGHDAMLLQPEALTNMLAAID